MDVTLVLQKEDGARKAFPVPNKAAILGRRQDCDFCIPLQVVSRRHCQLSQEENSLKVRDLRSSNGTFINGKKVGNEIEAKPGDHLQIGPLTFTIQIDGRPERINAPNSKIIQPAPDITKANDDAMNRSGTFIG